MDDLNRILVEKAQALCRCDLGFADLSTLPEETKTLGMPRAISVMVPLSKAVLSQVVEAPTISYFSHYRSVNRMIDMIVTNLTLELESRGYPSFPIAASQSNPKQPYHGVFSHKIAAVLSGKGYIGKNALFLHREYGSMVRLGTLLTEAPVQCEHSPSPSRCGTCQICRQVCPAMALEGNHWTALDPRAPLIDAKACSDYMKSAFHHIGRGVVCGLCITHCPMNLEKK
ncbi:MAG: epoxyqueuosine reductase [Eubacteriaceae bacterium]|nr:epoxyqueuosine reductase [Eubacteriaceae bacterium]